MKNQQLRELSLEELNQKLVETRRKLFEIGFAREGGQLKNNQQLKSMRREIARIYTIIKEKQNNKG